MEFPNKYTLLDVSSSFQEKPNIYGNNDDYTINKETVPNINTINDNVFYNYVANDMIDRAKNKTFYGTNIVNKPFLNNIFFNVRNNTYEVTIMWCLLVITIILLLSLLLKDANDEIETERVL